jgi:hypothetical protein
MNASTVKNSGGKIVPQSDFRVRTTQEVNPLRLKKKGHDIKRVGTWNVRTLLQKFLVHIISGSNYLFFILLIE